MKPACRFALRQVPGAPGLGVGDHASLLSGGCHLGGVIVAFQPVTGVAGLWAFSRVGPASTVVAPAGSALPW